MIKRLCLVCGCHLYREDGSKYCKKHRQQYEAIDQANYQEYINRKHGYQASVGREDNKEKRHYYNSARWRDLYKRLLNEHPVCECCGQRTSTHVHHAYPLDPNTGKIYDYWNDDDFYNEDMLVCLCNECHSSIHAELRNH